MTKLKKVVALTIEVCRIDYDGDDTFMETRCEVCVDGRLRRDVQVGYDKQHALRLHKIPGGLLRHRQGGAKKEGAATPLSPVVDLCTNLLASAACPLPGTAAGASPLLFPEGRLPVGSVRLLLLGRGGPRPLPSSCSRAGGGSLAPSLTCTRGPADTVAWLAAVVIPKPSPSFTENCQHTARDMMSETRGLYLKPPEKLPSTGVTKVTFKVFTNQLQAYLEQDPVNYLFLPGPAGIYAAWSPRQAGLRIVIVSESDIERKKLDKRLADEADEDFGQPEHDEKLQKLKLLRNSQLGKFVQLISVLCYYTEQDDVDQCSTSYTWITKYLEKDYNIES